MKIYIENQILEFDNDRNEIDNILNRIDEEITKASKVLNHMVINDNEIFNNYYDYFLDNINSIEKVEVILITYKELVNDTLSSTLDYLNRTPNLIDDLADSFYKSPDRKSWKNLDDLLEGIGWIINTYVTIDKDKNLNDVIGNYENWNLYSKEIMSLNEILPDFEDALSNQDNVSIADILSYEIKPIFETMAERLSELVSIEENINDLNW